MAVVGEPKEVEKAVQALLIDHLMCAIVAAQQLLSKLDVVDHRGGGVGQLSKVGVEVVGVGNAESPLAGEQTLSPPHAVSFNRSPLDQPFFYRPGFDRALLKLRLDIDGAVVRPIGVAGKVTLAQGGEDLFMRGELDGVHLLAGDAVERIKALR